MKKYLLYIVLFCPFLAFAQPTVSSTTPTNGATGVSLSNNLLVEFNQAIRALDNSAFTNSTIDAVVTLHDNTNNVAVPFDAKIVDSDKDIDVNPSSDLQEETNYTLTISPVENSSDQATSTITITFTTGDFTNPTISSAQIINNAGTTFTFQTTVNDQGTVYYVVTTSNTAPSKVQISTGKDHTGTSVAAGRTGSFAVTANVAATASITGLSASTKYYVHFYAKDEGNNESAADKVEEPVLTSSIDNSVGNELKLTVASNIIGDNTSAPNSGVYYVLTQSSTKPTVSQIMAGQDNTGSTTGVFSGRFDITNANTNTNKIVNGLSAGTQYHFHFFEIDNFKSYSEIQTQSATTLDNVAPSVSTLSPVEGAQIDISTNTFTITFDENVDNINSAASGTRDQVRLFEGSTLVETIDRDDGTVGTSGAITGTGNTTITIQFVYALKANTTYQIRIGDQVIEDIAGNNFDPNTSDTNPFLWNFTTTGVTANGSTTALCAGSFQSIGDIVISEAGAADINNSGTIELELSNTSDFAFQTTGLSASETGNDITISSITATFSKLTLTYTRSGSTTVDQITISGLKVYATGGSPSATIRRTGGTADWDGANGLNSSSLTFGTVTSGASAPSTPALAASQDLIHCAGDNLSTKTIDLVAQPGATFKWYNNSGLSGSPTKTTTSTTVNLASDLGLTTPAVAGNYNFYVVAVTTCQSTPALQVTIEIAAKPVVDAGANPAAICFGSSVQIGGSPTLTSTSISGTHTYSWSIPGGTISDANAPNPTVTPPAPAGASQNFNYTVTVTAPAPYGCAASDIVAVQVNSTAQSVTLAQPSQFSYTRFDNPVDLVGDPKDGVFSGVGVVQTGATTYDFDPEIAGIGTHVVTYTATLTNGCTKTITQNFSVSNSVDVFSALKPQHCSNEGLVPLELSLTLVQQIKAYVDNWNTYYTLAPYNYAPIKFNGLVRNYYDDNLNYGYGTIGNISPFGTYTVDGSSYPRYYFDTSKKGYSVCTGCNYSYVLAFIEFVDPNFTYPYSIPPNTNYGGSFRNATTAGFSYGSGESVTVNPIPVVFYSGLNGLPSSPASNQYFCNSPQTFTLVGNYNGGTFEISRNGSTFFSGSTLAEYGLLNDGANPGEATFNPQAAFNSNNFTGFSGGGTSPIQFWIRYTYDPGTDGGAGQPCSGFQTKLLTVYPLPSVAFTSPINDSKQVCYDDPNLTITGSTDGVSVTFSGYGISNTALNTGALDPDAAFEAKEFADNTTYTSEQPIIITATATSNVGCTASTPRTVTVRALPPATFVAPPRLVYCYEDVPFDIQGAQNNTTFDLNFLGTPSPYTQTSGGTQPQPDNLLFDASDKFDLAVANGADAGVAQEFDLVYTVDDNSGLGCTNSTTITLTVNPPLVLDIFGTDPGVTFCQNGAQVDLTGNFPGAGKFSASINGSAFVETGNGLINGNLPTGNGTATLNLAQAYDAADNIDDAPAGPVEPFYIRYTYRGPTCTGDAVYTDAIQLTAPPVFSFTSPTPADNTAFCYDQSTTPASVAIQTNTPANTTLALSGTNATFNPATGTGTWNPTLAFKQREIDQNTTLTTDQTFVLTATSTDNTYGCVTTITKPLVARVLPPASFTYSKVDLCYEDAIQTFDGAELNASYKIVYNNTVPSNYTVTLNSPDIQFDPDVYFEDAVTRGANRLATLTYDVVYTSTAGNGCTHRLDTVTFKVSPLIKGEIKGITNNDIFCSNTTDKVLEVTPSGGIFKLNDGITNEVQTLVNDRFTFNPPIEGSLGGKLYTFTYTVITGANCTNTETKSVRVLPSPKALFTVSPRCDTALIAFNANAATNLASSKYTWTFSDSVRSGTDLISLNHRFPGVSTYSVNLRVDHPAFTLPDNSLLVCSDSLRLDQIVGPYPKIDFTFFNVCEEDQTDFDIDSNIPISDVSWEFGDDPGTLDRTPFGLLSANIPANFPKTVGINEKPRHKYGSAGNYDVIVYGRTAASFGACVDTVRRTISILKKWAPSGTESYYSMEELDGGKGFWVVEDRAGNSSWEFASPTGAVIKASDPAWTTDADGTYLANDESYVNSPCFDLSTFTRPVISLDHWTDTPASDGAVLQYSVNGGQTWTTLGSYDLANNVSTGLAWYNTSLISSEPGGQQSGWSRPNQFDWYQGKHTLDVLPSPAATQRKQVRFRIAFSSFSNKEEKDGFAFKNVKIEERNRTILVENFSNMTSTANNAAYQTFKTTSAGSTAFNTQELVKLQYHTPLVANDELYLDNPIDQSARAAFYGVTQTNKAFIDGGFQANAPVQSFTGSWLDTYFSLRSLVAAPLDIKIELPSSPSDKFNVRATVTAMNNVDAGSYHVFIAVAEKDVLGQLYVLRKFLPDASGLPLTARSATDQPQVIDVSYDMRHISRNASGGFNPVAVIVFVQDLQGNKQILQTHMVQVDTPPSTIVTSLEQLNGSFHVYPNPADHEMRIVLPDNITEGARLRMFDQVGKVVNETSFERGERTKSLNTSNHAGGVYLIQIETGKGILTRKVMVLHNR